MNLRETLKDFSLLKPETKKSSKDGANLVVHYLGRGESWPSHLTKGFSKDLQKRLSEKSSIETYQGSTGTIYLIQSQIIDNPQHYGLFNPSAYAMARDLMGACYRQLLSLHPAQVQVNYIGNNPSELRGLVVGLEMASYQFKNHWPKTKKKNPFVQIQSSLKQHKALVMESSFLGQGTNLARFLVDLPPNVLQPASYARELKQVFSKINGVKVVHWDGPRLVKERMGLHAGVGQGSNDQSQMVHVQVRRGPKNQKAVAFVGKGVTFDTGGLDIKPSAGMRLMKKDMGGSAAIAGLAYWLVQAQCPINADFYFALAENSVSAHSIRPGDVLTSRSGQTVEIHNTDAEGRLVLADVMTVALEEKPEILIDVATLTGAIKQGLSAIVPGLFSNHDPLAETLLRASSEAGDVVWRMPLIPEERSRLKSDVADMVNCTEGFGGAVTAALFLESFAGGVPWAHFDIYAWVDRAKGVYGAPGGSGQTVQALAHFLADRS